jgi:hypothetical protein
MDALAILYLIGLAVYFIGAATDGGWAGLVGLGTVLIGAALAISVLA